MARRDAVTWLALAITTLQGLFMAAVLTWREIVRAVASALKWVLGLSIVFELWVSVFIRAPLLPNFVTPPEGELDPQWYWSRNNLFEGGRIQGIAGNANLLAITALLAIIVFSIRIASRAPRRSWLIALDRAGGLPDVPRRVGDGVSRGGGGR